MTASLDKKDLMYAHKYGNYLCIPNWGIEIKMADFNDTFWTFEKLMQKYPVLNRTDAVSITYAVAEIALIMG